MLFLRKLYLIGNIVHFNGRLYCRVGQYLGGLYIKEVSLNIGDGEADDIIFLVTTNYAIKARLGLIDLIDYEVIKLIKRDINVIT